MKVLLSVALLLAPIVVAQIPVLPERERFPQLTRYLELQPDQATRLSRLELDWNSYIAEKTRRVYQLEAELSEETAKPNLDSGALGMRYLELEAICREAKDRRNRSVSQSQEILTVQQKQRLAALEAAFRLTPVILEAQAARLMTPELRISSPIPGLAPIEQDFSVTLLPPTMLPGCRAFQALRRGVILGVISDFPSVQP